MRFTVLRVLVFLPCLYATATAQDIDRLVGMPLLVTIPTPPIPVRADDKYHLVYELHVVNAGSEPVKLVRAEISDTATLTTLNEPQLAEAIKQTGRANIPPTTIIEPGMHVVIMVWLTVDHSPASLTQRLEGTLGKNPQLLTVQSPVVTSSARPVRLQPPLRGDRWIAIEGPGNDTHHRRSWLTVNGRAIAPERFATDFLRVCENGGLSKGDAADNHNWCGYGTDAVAVAAGRVAALNDGVPDNVPANRPPSPSTLETISGNSVTLDLGDGRYAHYLHLQRGSLRVKIGDHVRVGQVLGLVGNSGNANGPHLHFQVSDGLSFLLSDGLPYVFESFDHEGGEFSDRGVHLSGSKSARRNEIPLQNWVVDFH